MREIKFRAWWKHPEYQPEGKMYFVGGLINAKQQEGEPEFDNCGTPKEAGLMERENNSKIGWNNADECIFMQYTGLKDKTGLAEVYEGDIIDEHGNIKGNIYQMDKGETDTVIQGFGTKTWCETYRRAILLGLKDAE